MSNLELLAEQEQDMMIDVVRLQAEGRGKQYIQQKTGASYKKQAEISKNFKSYVNTDRYIQERSREAVGQIDEHYTGLLLKFYEQYDNADSNDDYKTSSDILTRIANVEKERVNFLTKAGMISAGGIGDDLVELEQMKDDITKVLREIAIEKPDLAKYISEKLSQISGEVIAERVVDG